MKLIQSQGISWRARGLGGVGAAALLAGAVGTADAQTATPPPSPAGAQQPGATAAQSGDIIVTAQLRDQRLQDVPISVSVVTGDTLQRQAIADTKALSQFSPSLNFAYGASAGQSAVSLRGIASVQQGSGGIQPSVALVVDGVPVQRQGEFSADLLADVERIEVLGGPQGTLFGKNSTAGVVNITTRRPTKRLEGWVQGTATTDAEYGAMGLINAPLGGNVQTRILGYYRDQHPITKNLGGGPDVTGARSYGFTGKLNIDFSSDSSLLLFGGYNHINSSYNENVVVNAPPNIRAQQIAALGYTPARGQDFINSNNPTREYINTWNIGAQLDLKLGEQLKWVTIASYRDYKNDNTLDSDVTPYGFTPGVGFTPGSLSYPFLFVDVGLPRRPDHQYYWSGETRLHFDNGPVQAVVGLFYQDFREQFTGSTPFLLSNANPCGPTGLGCYTYSNGVASNALRDRTFSIFGDTTVSLTDTIKVFGGLRYTYENLEDTYQRKTYSNTAAGFFDTTTGLNSAPPTVTIAPTYSQDKVNNLSGRVGIQFQPTSNLNYYFSFAHGYKGPGADFGNGVARPDQLLVKPESADAFEIGAKQQMFGGKLSLNVAAYRLTINNMQVSAPVPGAATPQTQLLNVSGIRVTGVEGTIRWKVSPAFSLDSGISYADAKLRTFAFGCYVGQTVATGCLVNQTVNGVLVPGSSQDLGGKPAPGGSKWKYSVNANYQGKFGENSFGYFVTLGLTYQSSIQYGINQDPFTIEPAHYFVNASIGFTSPDKRWEVVFFGKNLTNEFYYSNLTTANSLGQPIARLPRDYKRYGGVKITARF